MDYPNDAGPAQRLPDELTLLDFLLPTEDPSDEGALVDTGERGNSLALFLDSLDIDRKAGALPDVEAERADIDAAILADRLFPQERLPSVISSVAAIPAIVPADPFPAVLRRQDDAVDVRGAGAPGWVRVLALGFVVSGVGLFAYAQGMRERDRRPTAAHRDLQQAVPPKFSVEVVSTRFNDATTAVALAPVADGTAIPSDQTAQGPGRVTHDPAVPVARILAVAERFVSEGDVLAARAMLEDLVGREDAHGLFAMAETFDPNMLAAWNLARSEADVTRAKALYMKALGGGHYEAAARLAALDKQ